MKIAFKLTTLLVLAGCNKAEYLPPATGSTDQALLQRSKLHTMYTVNSVPFSERHDIYLREIEDHKESGAVVLDSIEDVNENYKVAIVEKSTTYAIVLTSAKTKDMYFFWGPYSKDKWVIQDNEWLWDGFSDIEEMTGAGLLLNGF